MDCATRLALPVVPPLLAIVLAIVTRKAVLSLFVGVWAGAVIFTGGVGLEQTFDWIDRSISQVSAEGEESTFHAQIILFTPELLPVVVLFTAAFVAFSTGSSWGTMSIVTPIAVPVAWELTGTHTMVSAVVAVVFSGATFGDHASPSSDTTVLSATFTGADLVDHVRTQLYYAVTAVAVAALLLVVWGYTRITPWLLLPVGVLALVGLVYGLSELDANRRGIDAKQSSAPTPADDDDD